MVGQRAVTHRPHIYHVHVSLWFCGLCLRANNRGNLGGLRRLTLGECVCVRVRVCVCKCVPMCTLVSAHVHMC